MASARWQVPPAFSSKERFWIRDCYLDLYSDIRDLTSPDRGMRYVHISGNPGIGKSCFLWYVLDRLLKEEDTPAVIVELVQLVAVESFVFRRNGSWERLSSANSAPEYTTPGVWLLTDQRFVGSRAREGRTVLFASPRKDNWAEAEKTMNEAAFTRLYMPPWSLEELKTVYLRQGRTYKDFWKMYYVAGAVVRHYSKPFKEVHGRITSALTNVLGYGVVDATLFNGGHDKGQFSHQVFLFWPTLDFSSVDHISFVSEFAAEAFAIACFNGQIKNWMSSAVSLSTDRSLRGAAGVLLERYAHQRLAMGGEFRCVDDPNKSLRLEKRDVKFFRGNSLNLQLPGLYYMRPSSASFPVIDSVYPPLILFQISIAMKRKGIKRSDYEALCASLMRFREQHPDIPTGLVGVETEQVYTVLVKMEGDNTNLSTRMSVLEDVPEEAAPQATQRSKRLRASTEVSISRRRDTQQNPKQVVKRRSLPFQMTIALKVDQPHYSLNFPSEQEINDTIRTRLVNKVDTGARMYGDSNSENLDGAMASVIMRQGKGSMQYEEKQDGVPVFVVWMDAVRTAEEGGFKFKTTLDVRCTTGTLAGKELTIFINERLGPDVLYSPPSVLGMSIPGERVWQAFDEPALREEESMGEEGESEEESLEEDFAAERAEYERQMAEYRLAVSGKHEFEWSGDKASIVIRSNAISSRKIKLVFPPDESDEKEEDSDEDYMQV